MLNDDLNLENALGILPPQGFSETGWYTVDGKPISFKDQEEMSKITSVQEQAPCRSLFH